MPQLQSKKALQRMRVLRDAAQDVMSLIKDSLDANEIFILNQKQLDALVGACHVLDLHNERFTADTLRLAFGIQLDEVADDRH